MRTPVVARLLAFIAVAVAAIPAVPAQAAPQPIGACTTSSGAVLAVDFSRWGGPLLRSCGTTPTTGYELLNQGGWKTAGTQHDGPAFICRIGYSGHNGGTQYPTAADEKCILTPPAAAYWSYWHADPGQNSWSYSQLGAMGYRPKPGSVDLWIFGSTNVEGTEGRPTFSPDSVRAHNTSPVEPAPANPPPTTAKPPPATQTTAPGTAPADPATEVTEPPAPASASPSASPPILSGMPPIVDAAPTAPAASSTGSAIPLLVTGILVTLMAATAGIVMWRRRTSAAQLDGTPFDSQHDLGPQNGPQRAGPQRDDGVDE